MGIYFDPNIPNPYFAKAYLPNTILTGYKDSILRTAEGHVFACIHFDHVNRQVFDLAALNTPEPNSQMMTQNNVEVPMHPSSPSMFSPTTTSHQPPTLGTMLPMNAGPTNGPSPASSSTSLTQHVTTSANVNSLDKALDMLSATVYHAATTWTITQPRHTYPSPLATPYPPLPTFFWNNGAHEYSQLLTFGSTWAHANDPIATDNTNCNQYTPAEWSFLAQLQDYCQGNEDLRRGITIPGELCARQYLEVLGEEQRVSH